MTRGRGPGRAAGPAAVAIATLGAAAGCYRAGPPLDAVPPPGTRIVAELSPAGAAHMEAWIGAEATTIEARVLDARPDGWELSLLAVVHRQTGRVEWARERVRFPAGTLHSVRQRQVDRLRTGALMVGTTFTLYALARIFLSAATTADGGSGTGPDPPH